MSIGKYSPIINKNFVYEYNVYGNVPASIVDDFSYNEALNSSECDHEGFDSYGYSAFNADGDFVGIGNGVDRIGNTQEEYENNPDFYFDVRDNPGNYL